MMKVLMFKMTFKTRHFNLNQKVWIKHTTGAMAAECVGRFRGSGRYVSAWVNWSHGKRSLPKFIEIEVADKFATSHDLLTSSSASDAAWAPARGRRS